MHRISRQSLQLHNSKTQPASSSSARYVTNSGGKRAPGAPKVTHSQRHRRRDIAGSEGDAPAWSGRNRRKNRLQLTKTDRRDAEPGLSGLAHGDSSNLTGIAAAAAPLPAAKKQHSVVIHQKQRQGQEHSNPADSSVSARKNPELYSLTSSPQHQFDVGIPALPSISGTVGSTGSFGAVQSVNGSSSNESAISLTPGYHDDDHRNRRYDQQQLPGSNQASSGVSSRSSATAAKPEVLSPAGGWPQLRAAVENGADAVYFGVTGFNARARAANFSPEDVYEVMNYLHLRGVKGYVALNILVFDDELPALEQLVRHLAAAGVDAVIVQDVGAVSLIRRVAPNLPVHGSTQMSITSAQGAGFAAGLGVSRVVVGRELSIAEISQVKSGSSSSSVEVEAFCHGALCVSYSGQCYSSEAWGGRSANRGQCAQACRMPYGLIVNGQLKAVSDESYLLSPQDLMALDHIPAMIAAGVSCFKIEGRLKGPEYVAVTTAAYRAAVDAAWEQLLLDQQQQQQPSGSSVDPAILSDLAQLFSRGQDESYNGLTPGFLEGPKHQRLVRGRAPRHRGLCLGRVTSVTNRGVIIEGLVNAVKRGDGVVIDQGSPEEDEQGGAVWDLFEVQQQQQQQHWQQHQRQQQSSARSARSSSSSSRHKVEGEAAAGSSVELVFGPGQVDTSVVRPGDLLWKTRDPALESRLRSTYEAVSSSSARKLPVKVSVSGSLGRPLTVTLSDNDGHIVSADTGDVLLQPASNRSMTQDDVIAAVGQLGDNVLMPTSIDTTQLALDQGLFLPASAFKSVRRAAANNMLELRMQHNYNTNMAQQPVLQDLLAAAAAATMNTSSDSSSSAVTRAAAPKPRVRVLCRSAGQVSAAAAVPWLDEIIVDFLEVHGLKEAVAAVKAAGKRVVVAMPRIIKPGESRLLWFYLKLGADALLLRGAGCLHQLVQLGGTGAVVHNIAQLSSTTTADANDITTADTAAGLSPPPPAAAAPGSSAAAVSGSVVIPDLEGDFSLNASNVLSADLLLRSGLTRLCLTHDLNADQLAALAEGLGPLRAQQLEMICHQHLPIFHTEHCVFCRFLSSGNSYLDCGHPCEHHKLQLRDTSGSDHLVLADMGCRNTVFNASAQSGLYYLPRLVSSGFTTFRIELVDEQPDIVQELLEGYKAVLDGSRRPGDVWWWLRGVSGGGVSGGSLEVRQERTAADLRPTARRE